jgi:cellulose synthase/poly-beta-1,6-N-acetylglucosamine synthase-like glycosyltransferase/tetratricopeptide (TPR) repeat protein
MAEQQARDVSEQSQPSPRAAEDDSTEAIGRAEASLAGAERLLNEAAATEDGLDDATWQLTLAQWNLGRKELPNRQWARQIAMAMAATAMIVYLVYRLFWTLNLASAWAATFSVLLFSAELYAGLSLLLYFFQVWRLVEPPLQRPTGRRTVDVFVATYNEDVSLLRGTLTACLEMDYPHATYVLDDGAREEVRQLAVELGVRYISRTDRANAKAGNLNNALRQTDGEFVVVLDADHIPYRHFISRLIGYFDDPCMGFVQVPHTTYNLDNFMGRWRSPSRAYWEDVRIFFEAVQLGKNRFGVACFCGSAAIFRRKALDDVGLFATETITEDMHTGMRINAAGWKSLAIGEEMVVGLAPDNATTFASQRLRWGEGNLSVMAYDNPLTMKGLTLPARINYFASIASWTMGPARLFLYLTPLLMLLTGVAPVSDLSLAYFSVVGCYLITVWLAVKIASNGCGKLLGIEMAMMASFHLQLQALWRALFRRRWQKFVVTAKGRSTERELSGLQRMWPQMALVALSVMAVAWAVSRVAFGLSEDYFGLSIGTGLAAYHAWLALTVLARAALRRDPDQQWHHPLCLFVDHTVAGEEHAGVSLELNEDGCRLLAWNLLEVGWPLRVAFHTPVGETVSHGRVTSKTLLGDPTPFAYLYDVEFDHADPEKRAEESDSLRSIIVRYVVPVVTMTHRVVHEGKRTLPEELSGEGDFPIPVTIDTGLPNIAVQQSVALSVGRQGFLAATSLALPVGNTVRVVLHAPQGPIATEAEVADIETMRVGAAIVHQHEFRWRNNTAVRPLVRQRRRWRSDLDRHVRRLRNPQQPIGRLAAIQAAACLLAAATAFVFCETHGTDIFLAAHARSAIAAADRGKVKNELDRQVALPRMATDRLLRVYQAAAAVGDHNLAADAAGILAERIDAKRFDWRLTRARQLAHTKRHRETDAAFDLLLADPAESRRTMDQRAEVYVEAARAAVAVGNYEKAVQRFLSAANLKATDPEQAEELLGVLISAGQTRLAIQVLRQLDRTDQVLRHIVDVYEMARQAEKALPELKELHRRHPDDPFVVRRLAELAVVRCDFTAAVDYYRALRKLQPDDDVTREKLAESIVLLAREEVAKGRIDKAILLFDESFRIELPNAKLKKEYAGCLARAGRFAQAIAVLEPLHDVDSRLQLASVLEMKGDKRRSLQILLALRKAGHLGPDGQRSVARLLLATRQYEAAADLLIELLRQAPNDPQLQRQFLDAVAAAPQINQRTRAELLRLYRGYDAAGFRALDSRGFERLSEALRRCDMFEQARRTLDRAIAVFPKSRRLRFYLAQALDGLGRYDDAAVQYGILLAK